MKTCERSILNEIEKSSGYDTVLLTTYNFEIPYFEKYVLSCLVKNQINKINLFVDAAQLNASLINESSYYLGKEYYVTPVLMNASFHPKVILMLGDKRAKLIISSANIKTSGYMHNNEIYNVFEYTGKDASYSGLISGAINFFLDLYSVAVNQDTDIKKRLDSFQIADKTDDACTLLYNTQSSIMDQLVELIPEKIRRINIAVPFYDNKLEGLKEIIRRLKCDNVHLYIQNKKNTFPRDYNDDKKIVSRKSIHLFEAIKANKNSKSFYHGKVFELITDNCSYIMYGSANCSANALLKKESQNGNVECDVLVRSNSKGSFFSNFIVDNTLSFDNGFLSEEPKIQKEFSFVYGERLKNENILLYLICKTSNNFQIRYFDQILEYEYKAGYLIVKLPTSLLIHTGSIFELEISIGDKTHEIVCWYNDQPKLMAFRYFVENAGIKDLIEDNDIAKYETYITELFEAMYENDDWYKIASQIINRITPSKNPDDLEEDEVSDGFILDEDIDDNYVNKQLNCSIYKNTSALSGRYFRGLKKTKERRDDGTTESPALEYPQASLSERKATPAEKRLGRIFKRHINRFLALEKTEDFSYGYCKKVIGTISDLFERLVYRDSVVDFLDLEYVTEVKTQFAGILVKKALSEESFNDIDDLRCFVLRTLIEREYFELNERESLLPERMIYSLNIIEPFRERIQDCINELDLSLVNPMIDEAEIFSFSVNYIDSLFGYKTESQLLDYLKNACGGNVDMSVGKHFCVNVDVPNGKLPKDGLHNRILEEINRFITGYSLNVGTIGIYFCEDKTNNEINYEMKTNGDSVYDVKRYMYTDKSKNFFRCKLKDKIWKIDIDTRKVL